MTSAISGYSDSEAGGPQAREAITADIMARTGIDNALLNRVVHAFYDRVRRDALLGPVFDARIQDWPQHLERMVDFWSSVALMTGRYHGTPMQKHAPLPVDAVHFDRWLSLFEETVAETSTPVAAAHLVERARRIAQSLELGVALHHGKLPGRGERYFRDGARPRPENT